MEYELPEFLFFNSIAQSTFTLDEQLECLMKKCDVIDVLYDAKFVRRWMEMIILRDDMNQWLDFSSWIGNITCIDITIEILLDDIFIGPKLAKWLIEFMRIRYCWEEHDLEKIMEKNPRRKFFMLMWFGIEKGLAKTFFTRHDMCRKFIQSGHDDVEFLYSIINDRIKK